MCYLLSSLGKQLVELRLAGCALTSSSLVSIISLCNKLTLLEIRESGISSKHIQAHLISSTENRLPKLEKLIVNTTVFNMLMAFVTNPVNAVDGMKWMRLIAVEK